MRQTTSIRGDLLGLLIARGDLLAAPATPILIGSAIKTVESVQTHAGGPLVKTQLDRQLK